MSDWSSDVVSSDLGDHRIHLLHRLVGIGRAVPRIGAGIMGGDAAVGFGIEAHHLRRLFHIAGELALDPLKPRFHRRIGRLVPGGRSEEHTSELQSLMRISYAVYCLKKKKQQT